MIGRARSASCPARSGAFRAEALPCGTAMPRLLTALSLNPRLVSGVDRGDLARTAPMLLHRSQHQRDHVEEHRASPCAARTIQCRTALSQHFSSAPPFPATAFISPRKPVTNQCAAHVHTVDKQSAQKPPVFVAARQKRQIDLFYTVDQLAQPG